MRVNVHVRERDGLQLVEVEQWGEGIVPDGATVEDAARALLMDLFDLPPDLARAAELIVHIEQTGGGMDPPEGGSRPPSPDSGR